MPAALPDRSLLPDDVEALKDLLIETAQRARIAAQDARSAIERLELQLVTLRRTVFGIRSERVTGQADLFEQKVALPLPAQNNITVSYERRRRAGGRPALPADLPRVRIEYELSQAERAQFARVQPIGEETSETLEFTPARLVVLEHARLKYRCEDADGTSTIRTATAHPSPLARSNAGPGLLAHVIVSKYGDGLPLARQERMFARHGALLSRKTLCDWVLAACELLGRLRAPLHQHILGAPVVFSDDTTLKLRTEQARGRSVTARLWAYVSAGSQREDAGAWVDYPRAVLYEFTEDRRGEHPRRFLARYRGYLQADDYAGYHGLFRSGRVYHAACWAHARRGFFDIARRDATPGLAQQALDWIGGIYRIEREIRGRPPDERRRERQERTRPLLARFRRWLTGIEPDLLPRGPMAIAVRYVLSNWRALLRFTRVGMLEADSNLVERCMRPVAVGRKAWLFAGSKRGGEAAATALSLIESCKLNGIEPYAYLRDVLARIGGHRTDRLAELLPFCWTPLPASQPA
jgi:transposase